MKSKLKQKSIIKTMSIVTALAVFIIITVTAVLLTLHTLNKFEVQKKDIYHMYLVKEKNLIRSEVDKVIFYVENLKNYYYMQPENQRDPLETFQNDILKVLVKQRFNHDGYFFGSAKGGKPLFSNGVITKGTDSIWNLTDPDGIKIIQEQLKALNHKDGIFLEYSWRKLNKQRPQPKISYSKAIPDWDWVIGAGVYIDDIVSVTSVQQMALHKQLVDQLQILILIFVIYIVLIYLLINTISKNFQTSMDKLTSFFDNAVNNQETIDIEKLKYKEIKEIAKAANLMLIRLNLTQNALRKSERKYKLLAEIQKDLIITTDLEGNLVYCSPTIIEFAGYNPEEEIGKPVRSFLGDPSELSKLQKISEKLYQTKQPQVCELLFKHKSGEVFPVEVSITPIMEDDEILEFNSIIRNISKRKTIEKELDEYRKKLEMLVEERTKELNDKNLELHKVIKELERMNQVFTGREFRIKELRDKVKELESKL